MTENHINKIRAFNRFYTSLIGLLDKYILNSRYSLPEVRVLYELHNTEGVSATDIITTLHIDKGYLSRIIFRFEKMKLITKRTSATDGRISHLYLTNTGKNVFQGLNRASHNQVKEILSKLSEQQCDTLIKKMSEIKEILSKTAAK